LEDELSREFANSLPTFIARIRKREHNNHYIDDDPGISFIVKPTPEQVKAASKDDEGYSSDTSPKDYNKEKAFYDRLPNDYTEYMNHYREHGPQKINDPNRFSTSKKAYYPVRIPIVDPCYRLNKHFFGLNMHMYFKSGKP